MGSSCVKDEVRQDLGDPEDGKSFVLMLKASIHDMIREEEVCTYARSLYAL